jgi:hypothetical protein
VSVHVAHLELRVIPARHAVTRVLSCCTARGIEIVDLIWHADGDEARATLALRADPARLARVRLCLERLVDVLEVRAAGGPGAGPAGPEAAPPPAAWAVTRPGPPAAEAAMGPEPPAAEAAMGPDVSRICVL